MRKKLIIQLMMILFLWTLVSNLAYGKSMELPTLEIEEGLITLEGIRTITKDTNGYEEPKNNSLIIMELSEGQKVVLLGITENNWYKVICKEQVMYVQAICLSETETNEELQNELNALEAERAFAVEKDIVVRKQIREGRIWGSIIIILIMLTFGAGIIAVLKTKSDDKKE